MYINQRPCYLCHKLVPFTQPQLSTNASEVTVLDHGCPPQILTDTQDAIAQATADAQAQGIAAAADTPVV